MRRGTRVAQAYVSVTADGSGINDEIADAFDDAGPGVERAGEDHGKRYGARFSEGFASRLGSIRERIGKKIGADLGQKIGEGLGDRLASKPEQIRRGVTRAFDADFAEGLADKFSARFADRLGTVLGDRIEDAMVNIADAIDNIHVSSGRTARSTQVLDTRFKRINARLTEFENLTGRITGKGSRNNFLNFIGSVTRNFTRLLGIIPRVGAQFADVFSAASSGRGGGFLGTLAGLGAGGAFAIKGLARSAVGGAAALVALAASLGPIIAGMSLLLGTVTALAGSLTFALAGGLAAVAAGFLPVIAGAGIATLAIQGLDKAQKKMLANDFAPLVKQAKTLRSSVADAFVGAFDSKRVSGNLTTGLKTLEPLFDAMSRAVAGVAGAFSEIADSAAFRKFVAAMQNVLPTAIRNIGGGLAGFAQGFLGVLRALAPTIESVAKSIGDAGARFSDWANSASGQRSLTQFFEDSAESLGHVKDFLGEVIGLVGDLFSKGGRETGDRLFASMADAIGSFRKSISNGEIQRWFKDTERFAYAVGDAIKGIGSVIDTLDNSFTRSAAVGFFKAIALQAKTVDVILKGLGGLILGIGGFFLQTARVILATTKTLADGVLDIAAAAVDALANSVARMGPLGAGLAGDMRDAADAIRGVEFEGLDKALDTVNRLRGSLSDVAKGVNPADLKTLQRLRETIESIPEKVLTNIVADGTELSAKKIRQLIRDYGLAPEEVSTLTKLIGDEDARRRIANLIERANEFGRLRPSPLVKVRDEATQRLQGIIALTNQAARDREFTITAVYKTRREGGGSPGFGPVEDSAAPRASAGRVAAPGTTPLGRMLLPEAGGSGSAQAEEKNAERKGREAAARIARVFARIRKALDNNLAKAANADGASNAKSALGGFMDRIRVVGKRDKVGDKALQSALGVVKGQRDITKKFVDQLVKGRRVEDATLADYAAARKRMAGQIERANDALSDALALRDDYGKSVSDATRAFGALTTAQASVMDGVTQALTAGDITSNLQVRLDKIRTFQDNLRILLAQGLGADAYKQIVDAGVENGSAYADAIVKGGVGAINDVNNLVGQIGSISDSLGLETSSRLYQAGVDYAEGVVAGLEAKSARLDAAADRLGAAVARSVARHLGISLGGKDGGGGSNGGNGGNGGGRTTAARFSATPLSAPVPAATVSGNAGVTYQITIVTPSEDPRAVAVEAVNELTARFS